MNAQRLVLSRTFRDIRFLVYMLIFIGAVVGASQVARMALDYREGIDVPGVVVAMDARQGASGGSKAARLIVQYRLSLPDGKSLVAEGEVSRERWEATAVGSTHQVRYVPSQARVLGDAVKVRETTLLAVVIVLTVLVASTFFAGRALRILLARLTTSRRGVEAQATVVQSWQTSIAANGVRLWQVRYRYRDARGIEHQADSELLRPQEARLWQAGAAAAVLYDPQRPGNSLWLGHAPGEATPPAPPVATSVGRLVWPYVRNLAIFFAALMVAAVIAELPALKAFDTGIEARQPELLRIALATAIAGILLLAGAGVALVLASGQRMSHAQVEDQLRRMSEAQRLPWFSRFTSYRFFGRAIGGTADEQFSVSAFKRAVASGAVLRDARWRRRACAALGALLIAVGILGTFVVVFPLALKLICAAILLYVLLRVSWAFVRS